MNKKTVIFTSHVQLVLSLELWARIQRKRAERWLLRIWCKEDIGRRGKEVTGGWEKNLVVHQIPL
jgi:hypothetical protein